MADIDLKTETPDTSIDDNALLFGADSQASASPSVYTVQTLREHIEASANLFTTAQTIQPLTDAAALTVRRSSGAQTADILMVQDESNNILTAIDKDGKLKFNGSTSGTVTLQPAATAGTYTLTLPTNDGDNGQALTTDGSGVLSWSTIADTPGGSNTQLQFNNSGAFGGASGLTTNGTELTIASGTKTASAPVIDASQTWNASGVTFTGLRFNATDTASASGSLLMDLQVGSATRFRVGKSGNLFGPSATSWTISASTPVQGTSAASGLNLSLLASNATAGSSSGAAAGGNVNITAGDAARLTSGNANGGSITIKPGKPVGAGTPGVLALVGAESNAAPGTNATAGAITITSGVANNVGAGATTGSISIFTADGNDNFVNSGSLTIGTGAVIGSSSAGSFAIQTNRITRFFISGAGAFRLGAADAASPVAQTLSVQSVVAGTTNTAGANLTITGSQGTGTGAGGSIIFQVAPAGSSGTAQNALTTFLEATSARAFNLYNTTDVTTNFERGKIAWESNVLRIGTEKGGTGTARALEFQTDGTTRLTIATNGDLTIADAENIILGTTTGTKIGTATSQKIGFWNATPIVQPTTGIAAATVAATGTGDVVAASTTFDGYTIPQIVKAMRDAGLLA